MRPWNFMVAVLVALSVRSPALAENWTIKKIVGMEYPALARQSKMQATVKVKCVIGADGSVTSTEITDMVSATSQQASIRGILGKAAQENARQWKFVRAISD